MFRHRPLLPALAATLLLATVALVGQAGLAPPAQALAVIGSGTHLRISGPATDWVTQGRSSTFTPPAARFNAVVLDGGHELLLSVHEGAHGGLWSVTFTAPAGQKLAAGHTYTAQRLPSGGGLAGFDLSGDGRGCNEIAATFTISRLSFTADGLVPAFVATFRASCDGKPESSGDVALFGGAFTPPRPAQDPARFTALRFSGPDGEFISQGRSYAYTPSNATFTTTAKDGGHEVHVSVSTPGVTHWWDVHLSAPAGERITAGRTYKTVSWPAPPAPDAGFSLSGDGRACNRLTAWVTVWQASFLPDGQVRTFDATFVQFCESGETWATGEVSAFAPGVSPQVTDVPRPSATRPQTTGRPVPTASSSSPAGGQATRATPGLGRVDALGLVDVTGGLLCDTDGTHVITGTLTQPQGTLLEARASFSVTVTCHGDLAVWRVPVVSTSGTPFAIGLAFLTGTASGRVLLG